ncbi:unnamed protein product [Adineta ricciae]|uniref:G-protein coupled receptors family 1 profile domain-containing protein n=1 Tax=Adineta ricciae TaxID=249248 RepID=A0A814PCQ7_ADIRI|nr:unnamed protein product [Adineta ricciae]CAF1106106.1 unnamed protein product [Adineta ricciae]
MVIHFLNLGYISPATGVYCKFWMYVEFTLDSESVLLAATISVQRHLLIFRQTAFRLRPQRYIYYYLPLLLSIIYPMIFYLVTVVFYPCDESQWNFTLNMCGDNACYLSNDLVLAALDWILNAGVPVCIIMPANVTIIIRVVRQKARRHQALPWAKQRRMTLQLLGISCLYLFTWIPTVVTNVMQHVHPSSGLYEIQENYISDLTYLICLLLPWLCLGLVPDFSKWLWKNFHRLQHPTNIIGTTVF